MNKIIVILLFVTSFGFGQTRYASSAGAGAHDGTSEANAWSYTEMTAATAGMTVNVKAGNKTASGTVLTFSNNGTAGNEIKFIGYVSTPGDITSTTGCIYDYTHTLSSSEMPTITGSSLTSGTGISISGDYVWIENFQVNNISIGITASGDHVTIRNVFIKNLGSTSTSTAYNGFGIRTSGDYFLVENSLIVDANAEAYNSKGGNYGTVQNSYIYSNNTVNGTDYYWLLALGSTGVVFDGLTAHREIGNQHNGHGFDLKDQATYNTIRNGTVIHCAIELNFSGIYGNTIEDMRVYGESTAYTQGWKTRIMIANGAHDNTFRNIYVENTYAAFEFANFNDGYVGPGGDRDEAYAGNDNIIENVIVKNVYAFIRASGSGESNGNSFANCTFYNADYFFLDSNADILTTDFINCGVHTTNSGFSNITGAGSIGYGTSTNNKYYNQTGSFPSGWASTTDPTFVDTGLEDVGFKLQSGSPWIDAGSASGTTEDYDGLSVVTTRDVGAYEFNGGAGDTTAPSVTSITVDNITTQSFRADWTLDEGSKGRIYFDTDTGTVAGDYAQNTALESSFLTRHIQSPGPGNPSALSSNTTYYWRIYTEDAAGNMGLSAEQTTTTLNDPAPPTEPTPVAGVLSRFLKSRKF